MAIKNEQSEVNPKPSRQRRDLWLGVTPVEWLISGTAGIASAIVAAAFTIRDRFADEVKFWPGIKELTNYENDLKAINDKFRNQPSKWREHRNAIDAFKDEKALEINKVLKEQYGIYTSGKKILSLDTLKDITLGTWQRRGFAGRATEGRIAFNAIIGAVIGGAATLSFFNGVASRHKIERIEDGVESMTLKPNGLSLNNSAVLNAKLAERPSSQIKDVSHEERVSRHRVETQRNV